MGDNNIPAAPLYQIKGSTKFVIEGLPSSVDWRDLQTFLVGFAKVKNVTFISNTSALVEFEDADDALMTAGKIHAGSFCDHIIHVRPYIEREGRFNRDSRDNRRDDRDSRDSRDNRRDDRNSRDNRRDERRDTRAPREASAKTQHVKNPEEQARTVFIFGIPFSMNFIDVKNMTSKYGPGYVSVDMEYPRKNRGFAVVRFDKVEDALECVKDLDGSNLEGRTLSVRVDKQA